MSQLDLFSDSVYETGDFEGKECRKCGSFLPITAFSLASGGSYYRPECKKCAQDLSRVRNELRATAEPPTDNHCCPICKRNAEDVEGAGGKSHSTPWVLDHNHDKETARGWLCHTCNRALGAFSDDIDRLERAISYLTYYSEGLNVEAEDHLQRIQ